MTQGLVAAVAVVVSGVVGTPPAHAAGGGQSSADPIVVSTIPYQNLAARTYTDDDSTAVTDPIARLVSSSCGTGGAVYAPTWWRIEPASDMVLATQSATNTGNLIDTYTAIIGAVVSADLTSVVACARTDERVNSVGRTGPIHAGPGSPVYFVTLQDSPPVGFAAPALGIYKSKEAVPANDSYLHPRVIPKRLPYATTQNTTRATGPEADPDFTPPPELYCYSKFGQAPKVWYQWTAPRDDIVQLDVSGSSYETQTVISPSTWASSGDELCDTTQFPVKAGVSYLIGVSGFDQVPDAGVLKLALKYLPAVPKVTLAIDSTGKVNRKTGVVRVSGSFGCKGKSLSAPSASIDGTLTQTYKRVIGRSTFTTAAQPCPTSSVRWTAKVQPTNLLYQKGKAKVTATTTVCNVRGCTTATASKTVKLTYPK